MGYLLRTWKLKLIIVLLQAIQALPLLRAARKRALPAGYQPATPLQKRPCLRRSPNGASRLMRPDERSIHAYIHASLALRCRLAPRACASFAERAGRFILRQDRMQIPWRGVARVLCSPSM